jgi:hypothetical protein
MLATFCILGGLTILVTLSFAAKAILWSIPAYRKFKETTYALETAFVTRVRRITLAENTTVRALGHRRLPELFEISLSTEAQLTTCFGAIFLKEESIEEALFHIQLSSGVALGGIVIGLLGLVVLDPHAQAELARLGKWEVIPHIYELLQTSHLLLVSELLVAAILVVSLMNSTLLLHRIDRALR